MPERLSAGPGIGLVAPPELHPPTNGAARPYDSFAPVPLLRWLLETPDQLVQTVEGTTVFADLSGFTRLSERLARAGKEGAELLVDAINACFSELLANAWANGGSLLKFGGDALLLWFDGPEHHLRACASAYEMRRTLRDVGRIRAGGTQVVLRMSVGIHSGSYQMFLVGGSHREFMIAGPATTAAVTMEKHASAGQILLSPDTAALLPAGCLGAALDPGILIARSPAFTEYSLLAVPQPPNDVVASCLSTEVRPHVISAAAAPEHRTATIAFMEFSEFDSLVERHGPQAAAAALDELVRCVQESADRYQVCFLGSDANADGGKILLSAGAPRVLGDDEERLLLTLRAVIDAQTRLPIRFGINRGHVFTGSVGPPYRRTYTAMGDPTNLAARLMSKAPPRSIYATRGVLDRARWRFQTTPIAPFHVKGKSKPVEAWEVGSARRAAATSAVGRRLPLVGRARELELLSDGIEAARRGSGRMVEMVGETGAGKSRLLTEARDLATGMRFVHSTCEAYTQQTPYAAWREPLRLLLGIGSEDSDADVLARLRDELQPRASDLLPWIPLLAIAFDVESASTVEVDQLAAEARAAKLHEVVIRFLRQELVVPTLIEIEHAHVMDAASASMLEALAKELDSSAWLVLVTRRDAGGPFADSEVVQRIELGPLSAEDSQLLAQQAPDAAELPPHVVDAVVERAGGSPEFLLDLLSAAAAGGGGELPDSVGSAAVARIDALDPGDRTLVRRAAVLGLSFQPRHLEQVLGTDLPMPEESTWIRLAGVFARDSDGRLRFRRPTLQEAAHASLPFKLRRSLHAAVARRMEDEGALADPAALSLHFLFADDHARAHKYALAGAELATTRFSHADAARLYRRAIEAGRAAGMLNDRTGVPALARAWEQLGDALRCTGEPAAAARALTAARRLVSDDPLAQARLCHRHAEVAERTESLTDAVRWLRRSLRYVEGIDDPEATAWRARSHSYLAGVRNRQGRWPESTRLCRQAIAEAETVGELPALARACYTLDWALFELGHPEQATHSARALSIYEQLGDPEHESTVLNNLGMFAYFDGRWDEAIELYRQAGTCSERAGKPGDVAFTDCNVGEILSDQGRLEEAAVHLERARRVWTATGDRQSVAFVNVLMGRLAVRAGRTPEGCELLESAMADLRRYRIDAYADFAEALISEAEAFAGDPSRALSIAREVLDRSDRQLPLLRRLSGIALARLGDPEASREELLGALTVARERGAEYEAAATITILSTLGAIENEMLEERDAILERLRITELPAPKL